MAFETKARTLARTFGWHFLGWFVVTGMYWFTTDEGLGEAALFSLIYHAVRISFHYIYERIWLKFDWGVENESTKRPSRTFVGTAVNEIKETWGHQ